MKDKFQSKAVPRGTRTIWRYLSALFILFTFGIGQMWANDYTLAASTFNSEKNAATVDGQTFTLNQAHGGTGQTGYSNYIKFSKNKTYVMTLPTGFTLTNINIKGYTNSNGKTDGEIAEIGGNSQSNKTFPAKDDSNLGSKTQITAGYDFAISQTGGTVAIKTANTNQICVLITITGTPAASGPVDPTASFVDGAYTLGGADLDLSSLFSTNSDGAVTYTITNAGTTSAALRADGKSFYASAVGSATVKVEQAATASYNAFNATATITVSAPAATHSVTAATEDADKGTAAAAEATVAEGATTTITASPKTGYVFDHWVVSGAGATLSSTSANPTTLTMGTENATVTAYFAEKTCPTSGVLYTMTMKSKSLSSVNQNTEVALVAGDYATEEGGVSYLGNNNSDASKAQIKTEAGGIVYFNGNDAYLKVALDCPLQPGDFITIEGNASSTELKYLITNTNSRSSYVTSTNTTGTKKYYTVVADDILDGKSIVYFWREGSSGNKNIHSITITRPYNVTFVSDHGTAPTTPTKALSFTLTELSDEDYDHTGWTADKAVKVGGETKAANSALAVNATVELTDNTTFTATWVAKAPTFAVTYKANNGTEEADINDPAASTFAANTFTVPDGKMFAGWNTKADGEGTNYAVDDAVTADITVYAKWVVDPTIRLIKKVGEEYVLNTTDFEFNSAKTTLQTADYTVEDVVYPKNVKLGGTATAVTGINADKYIAYHTKTNSTHVEIALYDAYSSNTTHNVYIARVKEGNGTPEIETVAIVTGTKRDYYKSYDLIGRTSLYIYVGNDNARVCQVFVTENGEPNVADAPAEGYSINLNKGRMFAASGVAKSFEGLTYVVAEDYQPTNRTALKIKTQNTHYISFEIPTGQTRQLQLTASGSYNVSKTLGDESAYVSGNQNINLTEGVWYINPNGSNVNITNIAFAATPDPITVEFDSKGGSDVASQALFVGDKVTEPSPAPTKDGHRLLKWQKGGADYDFDTELVAGDAPGFTLDAVWQETVTITFDPNNTEATFTRTADKGAKIATDDIPANPTYAGYDFQGWTTDLTAEPIVHVDLSATTFSEATTLKAHWEVAQTDASLSALSYNGNAIDVNSAVDVSGVQTYTYHLQWGSTVDPALISVTPTASTATKSSITYNSEDKQATFAVTSGNGTVTINYAIQFVIDAKRGTSIIKAVVAGGDQKAGFDATGIYGDKGYAYTRNNKKMDTADKFVGVKLLAGKTFEASDKLFVVTSTPADQGYIEIYEEAEGTNLIKATGVRDASEGIVVPELAGYSEFYIVRKASTGDQAWNGFVDYIEVTREMAPAIKSFKFGDDAATINEAAKTITIEVPYATDVTALTPTVEAYGNNGATYTPAGATDFTSPVVYTVTDGYNEFHTDYTVTVNIAAPSTNAYLASLSVAGYTLDFNKEVEDYNIVLDYGTTVLPEITYAVEDAGLATAVKEENGVNGATTITVTPQAGAGYKKVYTINFSVSTSPKIVIYDGTTEMNFVAESSSELVTWTSVGTDGSKQNSGATINGKDYEHNIKVFGGASSASRNMDITIPANYVARFYLAASSNSDTEVDIYITKDAIGAKDDAVVRVTGDRTHPTWNRSDYLLPGHYFLNATNSTRLYELSVQLYPIDEERNMTQGRFGTICYPNGGYLVGAMLLEIAYFDPDQKKIFFDEVIDGKMVAGAPYLFLPNEGVDKFAITYTDALNAAAGHHNGLYGSYTQEALPTDGNHYIMLNNQYCKVVEANTYVGANRAYILLDKIGNDYVAPAYGRRRVSMSVNTKDEAQGFENLQSGDQPMKVMIDGTLYIIRGEKIFDATGRLVK